jgi:hypothetical protein
MLKSGMNNRPNHPKTSAETDARRPLIHLLENELISNESAAATGRRGKSETSEL